MFVHKKLDHLMVTAAGNQAVEMNPFTPVATVNISNVRQWDILCGKSRRCVDHDGSRRFRTVIECNRERYQQALTKFDKTSVTKNIYDSMTQSGSRFLRHNEILDLWEEISPMAARDKIGHALRFANRVSLRKCDTSYDSSTLNAKPAAVTPLAQPFVPSQAAVQPTSLQLTLKAQPIDRNPNQTSLSPTFDFVLAQAQEGMPIAFCSSFALPTDGINAPASMPRTLAERLKSEEHCRSESNAPASTPRIVPSTEAPFMGVPHNAMKGIQKIAPSYLEDNNFISVLNSAFLDSMNGSTDLGDYDGSGFDAFEGGNLTAHWDFDVEILSVLF